MRPQPGEVIQGKYRVLHQLADGGMGTIYEARHELLGTSVALKFLHPELAKRPGLVARFLQEAKVSATIKSPHIVQVLDVEQDAHGAFLVMELLRGETLQQRMDRQRKLEVPQAIDIATQILSALEVAHAAGVVHRDLKPDNVFLLPTTQGPLVKLLDFGIAKLRTTQEFQRGLTRPGVTMGTPEYMAPEQAFSADTVDGRADIYALGVMLFEMIAGQRPVAGDEPKVIAKRVYAGQVLALSAAEPSLPMDLVGVVHRAMAPMPNNRFGSAQEMARALAPFARRKQVTAPHASPGTVPPSTGAMTSWPSPPPGSQMPSQQPPSTLPQAQRLSQPQPQHQPYPQPQPQPHYPTAQQGYPPPPQPQQAGLQPGYGPPQPGYGQPPAPAPAEARRGSGVAKTLPPDEPGAMGSTTARDPLPQAFSPPQPTGAQPSWAPASPTTPGGPGPSPAPMTPSGPSTYMAPAGPATHMAPAGPATHMAPAGPATQLGQGGGAATQLGGSQPGYSDASMGHQTAVAPYPYAPQAGQGYYGPPGGPAGLAPPVMSPTPPPVSPGHRRGTSTGLIAAIAAASGGLLVVLVLAMRGRQDSGPEPAPTVPTATATAPTATAPVTTGSPTAPPPTATAFPTATTQPQPAPPGSARPPAKDAGAPTDAGADGGQAHGLPFPGIFDAGLPPLPSALPPVTLPIPIPIPGLPLGGVLIPPPPSPRPAPQRRGAKLCCLMEALPLSGAQATERGPGG